MPSLIRTFIVCIVAALSLGVAANARDSHGASILIIGDSLSAGFGMDLEDSWVALLQDRLIREGYGYRVVNASITGDTTAGGLRRLPGMLESHAPSVVLIELGGNDGLRGTPIRVIRGNLQRMIELSRRAGANVVLAGMLIPPNYGQAYTDAFAKVYQELAGLDGVSLIPFFMEDVALDNSLMQPDGIHPNEKGQRYLLEKAWAALEPQLAGVHRAASK